MDLIRLSQTSSYHKKFPFRTCSFVCLNLTPWYLFPPDVHLVFKQMLKGLVYWSNEKDEEAVEAGDEAHLESASMMWDHMVGWKQRTKLPEAKRRRYEAMGLGMQDVLFLANDVRVAEYFDAVIGKGAEVKLAANWIMNDIAAYLKNEINSINVIKLTPQELAELIAAIKDGTISGKIGKEILFELLAKGGTVQGMIKAKDLVQITDPAEIEKMVVKVVSENPKQFEEYRSWKTKLQRYFVGQIMKMSKGKANPDLLNKILLEKLNAKD